MGTRADSAVPIAVPARRFRRVGKGALAPCPPSSCADEGWWARREERAFAHPTPPTLCGISLPRSAPRAPPTAPETPARCRRRRDARILAARFQARWISGADSRRSSGRPSSCRCRSSGASGFSGMSRRPNFGVVSVCRTSRMMPRRRRAASVMAGSAVAAAAWRRIGSACAAACRSSTSAPVRAITSARRAASRQSGAAACQIRSSSSCHSPELAIHGATPERMDTMHR